MADSARNSARPCSNIDTLNGHSAQRRRRDRIDKFCRFFIHLEAPYIFSSDNIVAQKIKPDLIFVILLAIIYPPISANPTRPLARTHTRARAIESNNSLLRQVGKKQRDSAALAGCPKFGAKSAGSTGRDEAKGRPDRRPNLAPTYLTTLSPGGVSPCAEDCRVRISGIKKKPGNESFVYPALSTLKL